MSTITESKNKHLISRLKAQMLRKGFNPKTLAERANVGRSFVYDILSGKSSNPTSSKIAAIAEVLEVSVQYLLLGVHAGMSKDDNGSSIVEISTLQVEHTPNGAMVVSVEQKEKLYYFTENWVKTNLKTSPSNLRSVKVDGDNMLPTLVNGDGILIDLTKTNPTPAGIFILFDGTGLIAKRLEVIGKDIVSVMSDNKHYSSYNSKLNELQIIGKVVWLAREL